MLLTLAIPTYNRREIVCDNLNNIIESRLNYIAQILIIDNCSSDGSFDYLTEISAGEPNISILRNNSNIQLFGNVLAVLESTKTKYVQINPDEDFFCIEGVKGLLEILDGDSPDFISGSVVLNNGDLYRRRSGKICADGIRKSSNYGSAVVYNMDSIKNIIDLLYEYKNNELIWLYPMYAAALFIFLKGGICLDIPKILSEKKHHVETDIQGTAGEKYYHIESRIKQIRSEIELFQSLSARDDIELNTVKLKEWHEKELSMILDLLVSSLKMEKHPEIYRYFLHGLKISRSPFKQPLEMIKKIYRPR
jgi:glycosyltransferase involved in cell wall biosynthesis